MRFCRYLWALFVFVLFSTAAVARANPTVEGSWIKYESPRFFINLWKDTPSERLNGVNNVDPLLAMLEAIGTSLERDLGRDELVLGLPYATARWGKIAVFVYVSLEHYQDETKCFVCAAHVTSVPQTQANLKLMQERKLNPYAIYAHLDNVPRGLGGLSIGLPQEVVPHELTHVLDLTLVGGSKPSVMREGLAAYVSFKADDVSDAYQLGLTNQHLKLFGTRYGVDLVGYLSSCRLQRFTYNFGASFIDFQVRRAGMASFLDFFAGLRPQRSSGGECSFSYTQDQIDQLSRAHLGRSLSELKDAYLAELDQSEVSEAGLVSFEFIMDQVFYQGTFLSALLPKLSNGASLAQAARAVWSASGFDAPLAQQLRDAMGDSSAYLATPEAVSAARKNLDRIRDYIENYYGAQVQIAADNQLRQLQVLYSRGQYEEFKNQYVDLIRRYVTWKW